jgi:pyruvate dehydrogenase E2 component (dihydrolipoamide acetyltransferase)
MPNQIILPRLGNSVESSIIASWLKQPGEIVAEGDPICTVETDKTTMEVTSTASGVLLQHLVNVGDDVPILTPIALVGEADSNLQSASDKQSIANRQSPIAISPRARKLADERRVDPASLSGSGPGGRVIERDVRAVQPTTLTPTLSRRERGKSLTPVARAMVESGEYAAPERGSGPGGRITKQDLVAANTPDVPSDKREFTAVPLPSIRRVIAERMRESLGTTAQLTMSASADARALLDYRGRMKTSDESLGLRGISINDLVLFATARTLPNFPALNAVFNNNELCQFNPVHLGFAVDTPKGLLVPVIRNAHALSLRALAEASSTLAKSCVAGKATPDVLSGGTFTVTNLGSFGIESFTPILNAPQVAILGVGNVNLKPIDIGGTVMFVPHIGLSLTIDHQIVDGAPAARFLQALSRNLAHVELLLAI